MVWKGRDSEGAGFGMRWNCTVKCPVHRTMIWDLSLGAGEKARGGSQEEQSEQDYWILATFSRSLDSSREKLAVRDK